MCDQLHKFVICKCEIWDLGRKWEVPDRGGLVESCWDECEIRALLCYAPPPPPTPPPTFPSAPPPVWDQLFLTLRSFPVSSLIFYISKERIDLSSSSIPALSYSSSCLCSSVWTLSTFQLPIGILCYIVIFLNPLSPNTHQKGNGWIRSVPNMEKLLWRRSEKLMPPVSYLPFWQTDCFQWWSRLKSVVLHSPALLSSTEDRKFPNMADLTNWKRALLLDSINITTAAL